MSKSYGNTISLRDDLSAIETKLRTMPTDPARVRRTDPGDPAKCPVWQFHEIYSSDETRKWVVEGCRSASIGCIDCKQPVIDAVCEELKPIQARAQEYVGQPDLIRDIVHRGSEAARDVARDTLDEVRRAMGLSYK
jgi:tryptophanyl-tRNA synthetase